MPCQGGLLPIYPPSLGGLVVVPTIMGIADAYQSWPQEPGGHEGRTADDHLGCRRNAIGAGRIRRAADPGGHFVPAPRAVRQRLDVPYGEVLGTVTRVGGVKVPRCGIRVVGG